ncbi:MAG TPA: DUF4386 domain-containing protein [Candidatus Limnocylindrales bacterium]|nr:DUF4386 domain-containing protein [Candidatus Limnocylindrales bacterium]
MHPYRRHAVATGVLFILATVAPMIGLAVMRPALADPVDLARIAANEGPLLAGALLQLIGYLACPAIALALYPVLRHHGESMALGSVVFRTVEAVFYLVSLLGLVLLVTVGRAAVAPGAADMASYQQVATLLVDGRVWPGFVLAVLSFGIGALLYGWLLYRTALVPRWLAGWGIAGALLTVAAAVLVMVGATAPMSTPHLALNLPVFAQEMVLAAWLIGRGFSQREVVAGPTAAPAIDPSLAGAA